MMTFRKKFWLTASSVLVASTSLFAPLAQAEPLVIGQVASLTGVDAGQARAYASGMQMLFGDVNAHGGVNGHTFTLLTKDHAGHAENTVAMTRQVLTEGRPIALAGYFGNRSVNDLLASGILAKEKIALVGYRTTELHKEMPYVYNVRAGLSDEITKITQHLATIGITRLGVMYEAGDKALALLARADEAAQKVNARIVSKTSYPAGTTQVYAAVAEFLKDPPQAIVLLASGTATAAFIEQYRAAGGTVQLFANSGADIQQLAQRLTQVQMQGVAIVQVTPNPYKISNRLSNELNDKVGKSQSPDTAVSYAMMEGYIAAKVIVEAVRRQGARPTREGMSSTLDAMTSFDLGGYLVGFKPGMRSGSRFVELSIISSNGKIRQ
jgi:branched-chain amino acid transport system substrate-binding protein